jgi:hypothetical protein
MKTGGIVGHAGVVGQILPEVEASRAREIKATGRVARFRVRL